MQFPNASPWLHRIALLTCCATFPLIFMGGLVTSNHAGMSVPDWPNSYGYNMFLFPPSLWKGGILFEHTHRLMGSAVGFLAIVLASLAWAPGKSQRSRRIVFAIAAALELLNAIGTAAMVYFPNAFHLSSVSRAASTIVPQGLVTAIGIALVAGVAWFSRSAEPRRSVRWLTLVTLIAVCIQGLLGGLRVDLINLPLAIVHGCFAQAFFCLTALVALVTSSGWTESEDTGWKPVPHQDPPWQNDPARVLVSAAAVATLTLVYLQLVIGAIMRHENAGLAIPDLPLAYGHLLPPISSEGLAIVNHQRAAIYNLDPVSLVQIWLHFGHRIGATIVCIAATTLIAMIWRRHRDERVLFRPSLVLAGLLVLQVTLGVLTVVYRKPADLASAHVATGALVLVTTFVIAVQTIRLRSNSPAAVRENQFSPSADSLAATALA